MTREEANKAVIRAITEAIWNLREVHRVAEFYAEDYVADYRPYSEPKSGHAALIGMVERAHSAFSGYHEELHDLLAEGDRVVARFTCSGIHTGMWGPLKPTGKCVAFDEIVILTLRDGKVVHQSGVVDNLAALRQLGVMPMPGKPSAG